MTPRPGCTCGDVVRCERCTNCDGTGYKRVDGFAFRCGSCAGSGWVHGTAADVIAGIRLELADEDRA